MQYPSWKFSAAGGRGRKVAFCRGALFGGLAAGGSGTVAEDRAGAGILNNFFDGILIVGKFTMQGNNSEVIL